MSIQQLLGDTPKSQFVETIYQQQPFAARQVDPTLVAAGQWPAVASILHQPDADVMIVRRNAKYEGPIPTTVEHLQRLLEDGYTILVRHAERHDEKLAAVAEGFRRDFRARVNIHVYVTPAAEFGFGWHYDAEDVFIVQTAGVKEYSLRKNTVHPWPLEETLPADMHYEREIMPMMKCTLNAGDWLYIPSGYWHMACAQETAISLAIGVMPPTAIDIYDALRPHLVSSLLWRQRLPVSGEARVLDDQQLREHFRQLVGQLSNDLQQALADPSLFDRCLEEAKADP